MKYLLLLTLLISSHLYSQKTVKVRRAVDFFAIQADNLAKIDLDMSKQQVVEIMGKSVTVAWHEPGYIGKEKQDVPQPKYRDLLKDENGNNIEILWYVVEFKKGKDGCSPVILENNKVVGVGWAVFEDYRKRKKIEISVD
ncbi:MAG: hypothetical protein ACTHJN_02070 [Ginsengibacter sp.]